MNGLSRTLTRGGALLAALLLVSCGGARVDRSPQAEVEPLTCVALLPTDFPYSDLAASPAAEDEPQPEVVVDPADKRVKLQAGAEYLYRQLQAELADLRVTTVVEVAELRQEIDGVEGGKYGAVKEVGKKARCGAVLLSTLTRYRQRQGGELAVDLPASAAFELQLVESHSGRTLWVTSFDETQSSLLSNLFTFGKAQRRGFKWITVEKLVAQGVSERVAECPYLR